MGQSKAAKRRKLTLASCTRPAVVFQHVGRKLERGLEVDTGKRDQEHQRQKVCLLIFPLMGCIMAIMGPRSSVALFIL